MDLLALIVQLMRDGSVTRIATNLLAQFGGPARRYLGATLLPERMVPDIAYREDAIRYRTVIANDGSRYSPAQKRSDNQLVGSFLVELGNSDIAREMTGRDYEALLRLLATRPTMEAAANLVQWLDLTVNRALIELNEKQRWDALINAQVTRSGDNGYQEIVTYPNPTGHRVAAGGTWSLDTYDPYPDILAGAQKLADKGYTVSRIVTTRKTVGILAKNAKMASKTVGRVRVDATNDVVVIPGQRASVADLNALMAADGLPAFEMYDLPYFTQNGSARFLPEGNLVMVAETGRDETITEQNIAAGTLNVVPNTLGYVGVGPAVGEPTPGRVLRSWPRDNKPPRIEAEGWQTSLPVITEPEAIFVITGIA